MENPILKKIRNHKKIPAQLKKRLIDCFIYDKDLLNYGSAMHIVDCRDTLYVNYFYRYIYNQQKIILDGTSFIKHVRDRNILIKKVFMEIGTFKEINNLRFGDKQLEKISNIIYQKDRLNAKGFEHPETNRWAPLSPLCSTFSLSYECMYDTKRQTYSYGVLISPNIHNKEFVLNHPNAKRIKVE